MSRRNLLSIGILVLIIATVGIARADNGGYIVTFRTPEDGVPVYQEETREASFWELPLWIQLMYVSGALSALLVALHFAPFAFLKLKGKLENRNRESIYRHIHENPGCTVSDISRDQSMNVGSVRYHVDQLQDTRRIVQVKIGKFKRLFRNSGTYEDREIAVISALRVRTNQAILRLIMEKPGLSNKQIAERLAIKESMAHTYLVGLLGEGILRYEKNGQQKMYYLESDVEPILAKVGNSHAGMDLVTTV